VEREREEAHNQNEKQDKRLKDQQEQLDTQTQQISVMQSALTALRGSDLALPQGPPSDLAGGDGASTTPLPDSPQAWERATTRSGATLSDASPPSANPDAAPQLTFVGDIGASAARPQPTAGAGAGTGAAAAAEDAKKKHPRFFLPTSFMAAKLLTGLKAKTVDSAKEDPEPILLRIQAPAVLPNEVRAQLEGCFVVAHGFGSLASERVEARLVSLSCLDYEGRSVIEQDITGVVVDKDGVKGLAGRPVTKMGANLARLFVAGLVQGAGQAFQQSATTTSVSALGQTQTLDTDRLAAAGAGRGVATAANELTKVYAELVRQSAPVIEVGPTKEVSVFVTQGVWLEVKEYEQ
jgi:conjugal transfer pilus assembly protein TraB